MLLSVQDDPNYSYYVCELIGKSWEVSEEGYIKVDNIKTYVRKGDWVTKGVWLEWLDGGRASNWMTITHKRRECLVKLDQVIIPNLKVCPVSSNNPLPRGMDRRNVNIAKKRGAWQISDKDHAFLLEESHSREDACFYDFDPEKVDNLRQLQEQKPQTNTWIEPGEVIELDDESSDDEDYE